MAGAPGLQLVGVVGPIAPGKLLKARIQGMVRGVREVIQQMVREFTPGELTNERFGAWQRQRQRCEYLTRAELAAV